MTTTIHKLFDVTGQTAVITGGGGVLCSSIGLALAGIGVKVAILDISQQLAQKTADHIEAAGGEAIAVACDVLDRASLQNAATLALNRFGAIDFLINGAGGNKEDATTTNQRPFFDLPEEALQWVFNLNFMGTLLASQVFGRLMAERRQGGILNISSMNAYRPLSRIPAYSAAKAAVSNFTQWLAVYMAMEFSPDIRVNALAPGFFLSEQNRNLLLKPGSKALTARGRSILHHTPLGRFGQAEDLYGTVLWLLSPASDFITGAVIPVDGGFSAFSGV